MTRTWIGKETTINKQPFPHIIIDGFVDDACCLDVLKTWPEDNDPRWNVHRCGKKAMQESLPQPALNIIGMLKSEYFCSHLEHLFKLSELKFDESMFGGGLHDMPFGSSLGMHVDFNERTGQGLYRRVNCFLFLNRNWEKKHKGCLVLKSKPDGHEFKIEPLFNRLVAFKYSETAIHGVPEPLRKRRRSLACYFYTKEIPSDFEAPHSTLYEV